MNAKHILTSVLSFLAATTFAQTVTTNSPAPSGSPTTLEATFESVGRVETRMFIPADLMKGQLHSVGAQAENDGLLNTYFLYSGDEAFSVTTGIALRTRIREIYAIDKLRRMSKTKEFTKAMANAGKQKL